MAKMMDIDGGKLRTKIDNAGYHINRLSEKMGHSGNYLTKAIKNGRIESRVVEKLEEITGIAYESYRKNLDEPNAPVATEEKNDDILHEINSNLKRIADALEMINLRGQ